MSRLNVSKPNVSKPNKVELRTINLNTVGKYKDAKTIIRDGQGWMHDGYYCSCYACPYWTVDVDDNMACYADMYHECKNYD